MFVPSWINSSTRTLNEMLSNFSSSKSSKQSSLMMPAQPTEIQGGLLYTLMMFSNTLETSSSLITFKVQLLCLKLACFGKLSNVSFVPWLFRSVIINITPASSEAKAWEIACPILLAAPWISNTCYVKFQSSSATDDWVFLGGYLWTSIWPCTFHQIVKMVAYQESLILHGNAPSELSASMTAMETRK